VTPAAREPAPRRFFLCSRELGCPINLSLATRLHNYVLRNGGAFTAIEAAECIIVVSCSTLPQMRQSVAGVVEEFARRYPAKLVVVTCCYVERDRVAAPNVVYVPLERRDDFDRLLAAAVPLRDVPAGATAGDSLEVRALDRRAALNRPYNVMVAAGCLNRCAYCIGKHVFATVQSVPLAEVVAECREGLRQGYTNFVIGASDVGSYGRDLGRDVTDLFAALFDDAFRDRPDVVVGFKGFEPSRFLEHFAALKERFRSGRVGWLCLPIQSGSDRVLRSMSRNYRIADVLAALAELRRLAPALRIETDLIIGFPTETEDDFAASLAVAKHFDHVQMLMFERHEQTPAAALADVFPPEERERRRQVIAELQRREHDYPRPECPPRTDIELPSPFGATGFAVLEVPK
jgi:tRNA A37 methylthiotransferase MiaB